ncbi:hypothetical protein [Terriglobus tenax]|nr:hypothetical protein [Terriglobus tenax]
MRDGGDSGHVAAELWKKSDDRRRFVSDVDIWTHTIRECADRLDMDAR